MKEGGGRERDGEEKAKARRGERVCPESETTHVVQVFVDSCDNYTNHSEFLSMCQQALLYLSRTYQRFV